MSVAPPLSILSSCSHAWVRLDPLGWSHAAVLRPQADPCLEVRGIAARCMHDCILPRLPARRCGPVVAQTAARARCAPPFTAVTAVAGRVGWVAGTW